MPTEAVRNLAFAITEYQQNVLLAIALQEDLRFDTAFVRKSIALNQAFADICDEVVRTENTPYSWRNVFRYVSEFKTRIKPVLREGASYRAFAHSVQSPLVRLLIGNTQDIEVELFEDGTGSYLDWGNNSGRIGLRAHIAVLFINFLLRLRCKKSVKEREPGRAGWALYEGCFPGQEIALHLIKADFIRAAVSKTAQLGADPAFQQYDTVFVQSPYVEFGMLTEQEYILAHVAALNALQEYKGPEFTKILWKLHPRTDLEKEAARLKAIESDVGVEISVAPYDGNIEVFALRQEKFVKSYVSLGSSSLYVIKALVRDKVEVICVESPKLLDRVPVQSQLLDFFRTIGIRVVREFF